MKYRARLVAASLCLVACVVWLIKPLRAAPLELLPTQGASFSATLLGTKEGIWEFTRGENTDRVSLKGTEFVRYGNFIEPRTGPLWVFADNSTVVARVLELEKDEFRGDSKLFGKLATPVSALSGVVLRLPSDRSQRDLLFEMLSRQRDSDQIVLDNGDKLSGLIESVNARSLLIRTDTGKIELEVGRISAIAFSSSTMDKTPPLSQGVVLGFLDGSRIVVPTVVISEGEIQFSWLGKPISAKISSLAAVQPISSGVKYLSDLKESSFRHVPYLSLSWPMMKNANVLGQPLRANDKLHLKGLGMHTASRVTFRVPEGSREFQAELAIDDSAGGKGSAIASVFVDDGSGKWQPRYTSPIVRGGDVPVAIRIDLSGVKAISLLTDFADRGDELDHVDWLGARFVE